jgi:hypothetical protein
MGKRQALKQQDKWIRMTTTLNQSAKATHPLAHAKKKQDNTERFQDGYFQTQFYLPKNSLLALTSSKCYHLSSPPKAPQRTLAIKRPWP